MNTILSRRQVISGAALAAAAGAAQGFGSPASALAEVTLNSDPAAGSKNALIVIFLRGGADGLNVIPPHGDDDYYRLRPSIAIRRPSDKSVAPTARALDLDGYFGLHPALAPLLPFYHGGSLLPIHAVGSGDQTRSHFEAMATVERGLYRDAGPASGWLARFLLADPEVNESPLRAVAVSDTMPDSLRGASGATALEDLSAYRLRNLAPTGASGIRHHSDDLGMERALAKLYATGTTVEGATGVMLRASGRETIAALDAVRRLDPETYRPRAGVEYPQNDVGNALRQVACLVKGRVGLEVACLNMEGWDTHVAQGSDTGWQAGRLSHLALACAAFAQDLGSRMSGVTLVTMTEFGRRAYENSGLGTDHGRASFMFLLSGAVKGGRVVADWPGLAAHQLEGPGDLHVTTDYRDVLAEILVSRQHCTDISQVFPAFAPRRLDLIDA
ncbi:MAG: DUF1501 domain-containing protein [Armatimonadetes bacterium]|nr:DUF1501 domain-containing protein [Armatimonadota bacterium]MDE2206084.1 DUF1501 domain-containing protein [Armatimonadota bacterium]